MCNQLRVHVIDDRCIDIVCMHIRMRMHTLIYICIRDFLRAQVHAALFSR